MRVTIVGAGPVGLLLSCLLSREHKITILDKRTGSTRNHGLNISSDTINIVSGYLESRPYFTHREDLCDLLKSWKNTPVSTTDIESGLSDIASKLGVEIQRGINVSSIDDIEDSIIIGADGAHSKIRELVFNNETVDVHTVDYMAQLKYQTPGGARPRLAISAASYSFINGLSGSDIVVDFESMASPNDELRKPATLHIPIPESVYNVLSENGRGNYSAPWSLRELENINHAQVAKLVRIIRRYEFSLKWRGGWLEDAKVTVIPLTIYRSSDVVRLLDNDKLVMLVGDASSGLVFQRGLNKGFCEAVQLAMSLNGSTTSNMADRIAEYAQYCIKLYETERDQIIIKHNKILSTNRSTSVAGIVLTSGLGIFLGNLLSKSLIR